MTLREICLVFEGYGEAQAEKQALAYYTAYMSGVFSQSYPKNKYPKFEKHAPWQQKKMRNKNQSWQQQKMIAQTLNAVFGGDFKGVDR